MIGTLIAGGIYYANIGEKVKAVDLVSLKTAAVVRFPEALAIIYSGSQSLQAVTATDITSTGAVQADQPVVWAVATTPEPKRKEIALVFTLEDDTQATAFQKYLDDNKETTLVNAATVGTGQDTDKVTVTYKISS